VENATTAHLALLRAVQLRQAQVCKVDSPPPAGDAIERLFPFYTTETDAPLKVRFEYQSAERADRHL
jgi:hypothetical protein